MQIHIHNYPIDPLADPSQSKAQIIADQHAAGARRHPRPDAGHRRDARTDRQRQGGSAERQRRTTRDPRRRGRRNVAAPNVTVTPSVNAPDVHVHVPDRSRARSSAITSATSRGSNEHHPRRRRWAAGRADRLPGSAQHRQWHRDGCPDQRDRLAVEFQRSCAVTARGSGFGGGGLAHSFVGYNTIGASDEMATLNSQSTARASRRHRRWMLLGFAVYIKQTSNDNLIGLTVGINADNAGSPGSWSWPTAASGQLQLKRRRSARLREDAPVDMRSGLARDRLPVLPHGKHAVLVADHLSPAARSCNLLRHRRLGPDQQQRRLERHRHGPPNSLTNSTKSYSIRGDYLS